MLKQIMTISVLGLFVLVSAGCPGSGSSSSSDSSPSSSSGTTTTTMPSGPITPGTSLSFSSVTPTGFTVNWGQATDTGAAQSSLQYTLFSSTSNNISTATDAVTNGTLGMAATTAATSVALSSLSASTTYYVTVIVTDPSSNSAVYTGSTTTPANCPSAGGGYQMTGTVGSGDSGDYAAYITGASGTISSVTLYLTSASTNSGIQNLYANDNMTLTAYNSTFGGSVLGTSTKTVQLGPTETAVTFNFTQFSASSTVVFVLTLNSASLVTGGNATTNATMYVVGAAQNKSGHFCTMDIANYASSGAPSSASGTWDFAGYITP